MAGVSKRACTIGTLCWKASEPTPVLAAAYCTPAGRACCPGCEAAAPQAARICCNEDGCDGCCGCAGIVCRLGEASDPPQLPNLLAMAGGSARGVGAASPASQEVLLRWGATGTVPMLSVLRVLRPVPRGDSLLCTAPAVGSLNPAGVRETHSTSRCRDALTDWRP